VRAWLALDNSHKFLLSSQVLISHLSEA
jgi:hypothetical protein